MQGVLREILADLKINVDLDKLQKADNQISRVARSVAAVGGVLGAGAAVRGIARFTTEVTGAADALDKTATSLGFNTRALAQWGEVVENAGGQEQQFQAGLKNLSRQYTEALKGGEGQVKTFRKLGVSLRDARGRTRELDDVLEDAVLGLSKYSSGARRAAVADSLFGEAGQALIRVSLDGKEALDEQREAFDRLNQGARFDEFVERSKEAAVALDGWRNASTALKRNLARALAPALTALARLGTRVVDWFQRLSANTRVVEVALGTLAAAAAAAGIALTVAFAGPVSVVLGIAAGIAAVVLVVDDLIALFTGGRSAIGAFIDSLFGIGSAEAVVQSLKDLYEGMVSFTYELIVATVELGTAIGEGFARAVLAAREFVEYLIDKVRGAIDWVADGLKGLADFVVLGDGDAPEDPSRPRGSLSSAIASLPSVEDLVRVGAPERGARVSAPPGSSRADVRVQSPVSVTVQGATDPAETARRVGDEVRRVQVEDLELARDLLLGLE